MSDYKDGFLNGYDYFFHELMDTAEHIVRTEIFDRKCLFEEHLLDTSEEYETGYSQGLSEAKARALSTLGIIAPNAKTYPPAKEKE